MSLRKPAKDQPESFEFNSSSLKAANSIIAKYPEEKKTECSNGFIIYCPKTKQ